MEKKNVLIIGGSSSVGKSLMNCFSDSEKYNVIATYNNNKTNNPNVTELKLDLLSKDSMSNFFKSIEKIDFLITLPSLLLGSSILEYDEDDIDLVFNVNAISIIKIIKIMLPKFNLDARVIIVSSISAERGSYDPVYAATKGTLIPFAKSLATWMGDKIKINIITPGLIEDTNMYDKMSEERKKYHKDLVPTGHLTKIDDLVRIIYDILQPHWRNVNGEVIRINGGVYV